MKGQIEHWEHLASLPPDASVIDPLDSRGHKNRYIATLRNRAILSALGRESPTAPILDLGCGTGGLSAALVAAGKNVVGMDISAGLLTRAAERGLGEQTLFLLYDGSRVPLGSSSVSAAVTYVVLTHVMDDGNLVALLREVHRVLLPGARLLAIEQVKRRRTVDFGVWQCRRTVNEFSDIFVAAGFSRPQTTILRYGRFPSTFAVALGCIPEDLYPRLHAMERAVGQALGPVPWDYCDMLFSISK